MSFLAHKQVYLFNFICRIPENIQKKIDKLFSCERVVSVEKNRVRKDVE